MSVPACFSLFFRSLSLKHSYYIFIFILLFALADFILLLLTLPLLFPVSIPYHIYEKVMPESLCISEIKINIYISQI